MADEFVVSHEGQIWMVGALTPDVGFIVGEPAHEPPRHLGRDPNELLQDGRH